MNSNKQNAVLVTININHYLCPNSRRSFQAAAKRWGVEFIEITEETLTTALSPIEIKLRLFELIEAQRIFYIDGDAIIREDTPSPFDLVSSENLGVVRNNADRFPDYKELEKIEQNDWQTLNSIYEKSLERKDYFNAGVLVITRESHLTLFARALEIYNDTGVVERLHWDEQSTFNYAAVELQQPITHLDYTWNYIRPDVLFADGGMQHYIYHYAGDKEKAHALCMLNWQPFSNPLTGSTHVKNGRYMYNDFLVRSGTIDQYVVDEVCLMNTYRIPHDMSSIDLVLDIGAHLGSFTKAVLDRGAKKVIAVEANAENFDLASLNISNYIERGAADLIYGAVWRSDNIQSNLSIMDFPSFKDGVVNTGGSHLMLDVNSEDQLDSYGIDELLERYATQGDKVLIKLDCEGAEWPILYTSKSLKNVHAICGELHGSCDPEFKRSQGTGPFVDSAENLKTFLHDLGFKFRYVSNNPSQNMDPMGLFWAAK